jgi:hypothetical protein
VAAAVVGVALLTPAAPASAGTNQCWQEFNNAVCFWQDSNYSGGFRSFRTEKIDNFIGYTFDNNQHLNDNITSYYNNTACTLRLYTDWGQRGNWVSVGPRGIVAMSGINDQASSYQLIGNNCFPS